MKKYLVLITIACAVSAFAQTPIPPQKPLFVGTEVGEVAGAKGKIQVLIWSTVEPKKVSVAVQILDKATLGGKFEIDASVAPVLAKTIDEASNKLLAGEVFSGKAGTANVAVIESGGQKAVVIKFDRAGISFTADSLALDADNAAALARILARANQVAAWLTPRLNNLQAQ